MNQAGFLRQVWGERAEDIAAMESLRLDAYDLARGRIDFCGEGPDGGPVSLGWFKQSDGRLKFRLTACGRTVECSDADLMMATFRCLRRSIRKPLPVVTVPNFGRR